MSVESGVGVACGCLPGCKPLMNRMFPRIFANTSQNSYPRPNAQDRVKQLEAGRVQRSDRSYKMRDMSVDEIDVVIPARPQSGLTRSREW